MGVTVGNNASGLCELVHRFCGFLCRSGQVPSSVLLASLIAEPHCRELSLAVALYAVRLNIGRERTITQSEARRGFRATDRLLLARNPLLDGLPEEVIAATLEHGLRRHVDTRTTVIEHGAIHQELLFLLSGAVSVITILSDGHEWMTDIIGAGGMVGGLAMRQGSIATAAVVSRQSSFFLVLPHNDLRAIIRKYPILADAVSTVLEARVRQREEFIADVMFASADKRIAKCLLLVNKVFTDIALGASGETESERRKRLLSPVNIKISQQELATMAGLSREGVNKQLQQWMREGVVGLTTGHIEVLRPEYLQEMVDS
jgi:CRP/FNR family cyclic AMP-dependent transcriptional regulator